MLAVFILFIVFYVIGVVQKNVNTVDIAYGMGFIVAAVLAWILSDNNEFFVERKLLATGLVALWGIRVALFLTLRRHGKDETTTEDRRFKNIRDAWGKSFVWKSFFTIYLSQVLLIMLIGLPVLVLNIMSEPGALVVTDYIGTAIWIIGFLFEFTADLQLVFFKRNPVNKGKVLTKGLFRFSRHPNYFGEITMWFGLFVVALFDFTVWNFVSIISPILIALSYYVNF